MSLPGTNVIDSIVPFTALDNYPTHMAIYGKGGWRTVNSLAERDSIPNERREEGMVVYVIGDNTYQLVGGITNSHWQIFTTGSSGGSFLTVVSVKSNNYNANSNELIPVDVSNNPVSIYLPLSPSNGDAVQIVHIAGSLSTNNLIIEGNGNFINGTETQFQIDIQYGSVMFRYLNPLGWVVIC